MTYLVQPAPAQAHNAIELYGGQVVLRFDRAKHRYFATENGTTCQIASVTQILGVMDKPGLLQWAANCAGELLAERLQPGQALDEVGIAELADAIRFAHRRVSGRAKCVGALAHDWIERYLAWLVLPTGRRERQAPSLPVNEQAHRACLAARAGSAPTTSSRSPSSR